MDAGQRLIQIPRRKRYPIEPSSYAVKKRIGRQVLVGKLGPEVTVASQSGAGVINLRRRHASYAGVRVPPAGDEGWWRRPRPRPRRAGMEHVRHSAPASHVRRKEREDPRKISRTLGIWSKLKGTNWWTSREPAEIKSSSLRHCQRARCITTIDDPCQPSFAMCSCPCTWQLAIKQPGT